jgi:protein CpxP
MAAGLLIANILLAAFIVFGRPPGRPHVQPREIIIERLHFDDQQVRQYDKLIRWHRAEINKKDREIMDLKNKLYAGLSLTGDTVNKDSLIAEIGRLQMQVEDIHYRHFEDIGRLCNEQQKMDYEALLRDMADIFSRPKKEPK